MSKPIERAKKLFRLAKSSNPNEAQSAMEKANALIKCYGISSIDLAEEITEPIDEANDYQKIELAKILAKSFNCTLGILEKSQLAIRGKPDKVTKAGAAYRASLAVIGDEDILISDSIFARRIWKNCYWMGFRQTISERIIGPNRSVSIDIEKFRQHVPQSSEIVLHDLEHFVEETSYKYEDPQSLAIELKEIAFEAGTDAALRVNLGH